MGTQAANDDRAERNETLIEGQKRALERAVHGAPLSEVLSVLVRTIEGHSPSGVLGSILLLDEAGERLLLGAAPSLPGPYNEAIHGIVIGPTVGSCGTAAHTRSTVVVRDIAEDPLWADFKALALSHGLRACWSTPIFSSGRAVLGTFALYHREVAEPSARDIEVVALLAHTAALVIERDANARQRASVEAELRASVAFLAQARAEAEAARVRAEASEQALRVFVDNLTEQTRDVKRALLEMRLAKEHAETRLAALEASATSKVPAEG